MFSRLFYADLASRLRWAVSRRWYHLRVSWHAWDKEPWVFALVLGLIAAAFFFALRAAYEHQDHRSRKQKRSEEHTFERQTLRRIVCRRITKQLTHSNLKLLRRITRTETI